MGVTVEKSPSRLSRAFRLFTNKTGSPSLSPSSKSKSRNKKTVNFQPHVTVYTYEGPTSEERASYYPETNDRLALMYFRRGIMNGYQKGSAAFKEAVEKLYTEARRSYDADDLSSQEFVLDSEDQRVHAIVSSDMRGLEEFYCRNIFEQHRSWAMQRVLQSQRDPKLYKRLHEVATTVSIRSKNFARLVAVGDAQQLQ